MTNINETGKMQWLTKKSSGTFARDAGGGESERGTIAGLDEDHIYHHKGLIVNCIFVLF